MPSRRGDELQMGAGEDVGQPGELYGRCRAGGEESRAEGGWEVFKHAGDVGLDAIEHATRFG